MRELEGMKCTEVVMFSNLISKSSLFSQIKISFYCFNTVALFQIELAKDSFLSRKDIVVWL